MSEIKVDNLTGKTTAKTVTVTVGASATQSLEQGLAKAWINFDGTATGAVADYDRDSFNMSVTVDNGTGDFTLGFTNNMGNANYCAVSGGHTSAGTNFSIHHTFVTTLTTSSLQNLTNDGSGSSNNWNLSNVLVHGDLA